uniref:Uncharacterized protein n=1 Tax=Cannabis sativa TaxID=3483 RepID=A0A803QCI4_CANSA
MAQQVFEAHELGEAQTKEDVQQVVDEEAYLEHLSNNTRVEKKKGKHPQHNARIKGKNKAIFVEDEEDDFLLEEEEYADVEHEHKKDLERTIHPRQWWSSVTQICSENDQVDSEGVVSEDDLHSLDSEDEGNATIKRSKKEYNLQTSFENFEFAIGMEFPTMGDLRYALREYFIANDKEYKFVFNDNTRIRAKCKAKGCGWYIYGRLQSGKKTIRVNKFEGIHDCGLIFDNKLVTSAWLAKHFLDQFRIHPNMEYQGFQEMTSTTKYSNVSASIFYRTKRKAREMLEGSLKDQYVILDDYCRQLMATNPSSAAILKTRLQEGERVFERVYICLKACKDGFNKGCRPLLGLDGCFLKGYCRGILLAAIGIDPNNSQFSVAYAIVENENKVNWTWFLKLLVEDLNIQNPSIFTMMSDRQKGLEIALAEVFIDAEIRFCVRHLHSNFKKEHSGLLLKQMLWACARATTPEDFTQRMNELKEVDEKAYQWLLKKDPKEWSKSHFRVGVKCDMLLNNLCESFNSAILPARDKPIVTLLEKIRFWLMCRFTTKREDVKKWLYPIGKRICDIIENTRRLSIIVTQPLLVVVSSKGFQLTGIRCPHAFSAILASGLDYHNSIDEWYKQDAYIAAYSGIIEPMPSPDKWLNTGLNPILPPPEQALPGRPKKKRNRSNDEPPPDPTKQSRKGQANYCSNCKQSGHSKLTCKNELANKQKVPKKRGRPPKDGLVL